MSRLLIKPTSNILVNLDFGEGTGNNCYDPISGKTCSNILSTRWEDGKFGKAYALYPGDTAYGYVAGGNGSYFNTVPMTAVSFFKLTARNNLNSHHAIGGTNANANGWRLLFHSDGDASPVYCDWQNWNGVGSSGRRVTSSINLNTLFGKWTMFASTLYSNGTQLVHEFYINGNLIGTTTGTNGTSMSTASSTLYINNIISVNGTQLNGAMDSCTMYNVRLTAKEVKILWDNFIRGGNCIINL